MMLLLYNLVKCGLWGRSKKKKNSIEKEELVFLCIFYGEVVGKSFVDMGLSG